MYYKRFYLFVKSFTIQRCHMKTPANFAISSALTLASFTLSGCDRGIEAERANSAEATGLILPSLLVSDAPKLSPLVTELNISRHHLATILAGANEHGFIWFDSHAADMQLARAEITASIENLEHAFVSYQYSEVSLRSRVGLACAYLKSSLNTFQDDAQVRRYWGSSEWQPRGEYFGSEITRRALAFLDGTCREISLGVNEHQKQLAKEREAAARRAQAELDSSNNPPDTWYMNPANPNSPTNPNFMPSFKSGGSGK